MIEEAQKGGQASLDLKVIGYLLLSAEEPPHVQKIIFSKTVLELYFKIQPHGKYLIGLQ